MRVPRCGGECVWRWRWNAGWRKAGGCRAQALTRGATCTAPTRSVLKVSSLRSVATPTATTRSHPTLESTPAATPKRSEVCHSLPAYRKAHVATRVRTPHIISTWIGVGVGVGQRALSALAISSSQARWQAAARLAATEEATVVEAMGEAKGAEERVVVMAAAARAKARRARARAAVVRV